MQKTKEQLYDQIKDLKTKKEFNSEIKKRQKENDDLLDEDTIALLIVDELGRNQQNISKISDLQPGTDTTIYAKVTNISKSRTFNRKNGSSGRVINLEITDELGTCGLALWDQDVELVKNGSIKIGTNVKVINGYVKDGFNGLEINIGRYGMLKTNPEGMPELKDETPKNNKNMIDGKLVGMEPTRAFFRDNGDFGFVAKIQIENKDGIQTLSVWDEKVKEIQKFKEDDTILIENIDFRQRNGETEIHVNGKATIKKL